MLHRRLAPAFLLCVEPRQLFLLHTVADLFLHSASLHLIAFRLNAASEKKKKVSRIVFGLSAAK
jgi:hypothetical protein